MISEKEESIRNNIIVQQSWIYQAVQLPVILGLSHWKGLHFYHMGKSSSLLALDWIYKGHNTFYN